MDEHVTLFRSAHRSALRVPTVGTVFWIIKAMSTALGESTSDYLVHVMNPVLAVLLGFAGFVGALTMQFRLRRYHACSYWLTVVMVGIFGTMAADVLHVGFGVPYFASTFFNLAVLGAVFYSWWRVEKSLSMHSIDTVRRECFYWSAVVATFALGTAAGDMTAMTLKLGYALSVVLFALAITIPMVGYWQFGWNPIAAFWIAYVITRPLGASIADWFGKTVPDGGLGVGDGLVSLVLALGITLLVGALAFTGKDIQQGAGGFPGAPGR
jgi:uncharacterized membrane-anchored protein